MKTKIFYIVLGLFLYTTNATALNTTGVTISGNLDASSTISAAPVLDAPTTFAALNAQAAFSTAIAIYDSLCVRHDVTLYFFHTGAGAWTVHAYIDGSNLSGGTSGIPAPMGTVDITFDQAGNRSDSHGFAISPSLFSFGGWSNGARNYLVDIALNPITQFSANSAVNSITQDGGPLCVSSSSKDYDGDGIDDYAIWRPAIGFWAILKSSTNNQDYIWKQWGLPGDYPMAGDYTGDGLADLVVWRPSNGNWYVCSSESNFDCAAQGTVQQFGLPGDKPVRGDFDGDNVLDYAVWRASTQTFYYKASISGNSAQPRQWGLPGDIPLGAGVSQ